MSHAKPQSRKGKRGKERTQITQKKLIFADEKVKSG
jgi:hypothetical protein